MLPEGLFESPGTRNRVVYEEANFPSVRYLYQAQPDLEVVAVEDDRAIVEAIDERTLLVPISHVLFKNAEIQDVEPIVRRAHEVGAYVVLDCYQSAGVVPFDLAALDVDFAVGGSVKWLCGGPGRRLALRQARISRSGSSRPSSAGRGTRARSRSSPSSSTRRACAASSRARRTCRRSTRRARATT